VLVRIKHLIIKEFIQSFRDKRLLFIIFIAPMIQLILFGFAINTDIKDIPTLIMDLDRSAESRSFISAIEKSGNFRLDYYVNSEKEIIDILDRGKADLAVRIYPGFEKNLKKGNTATIQLIIDGSNSNSAAVILNHMSQISSNYSTSILIDRIDHFEKLSGKKTSRSLNFFSNEARIWYNPSLKSRISNIPGVLAFILLILTVILTSVSIVKERERGTIEQLMVSPIKPVELVIGKTIPFAIIGFIDVLIVISLSFSLFDIPLNGSLTLLFFAMLLYLLNTLGIGLFISTVSKTQQQAMMSSFFFTMPAVMLSGFVFPIENMPKAIQFLTYVNPVKYFLIIINGIFLKGIGLSILWPDMLALGGIGFIILFISVIRFKKRLE
jgi:ABC-2 type transport system permease protein